MTHSYKIVEAIPHSTATRESASGNAESGVTMVIREQRFSFGTESGACVAGRLPLRPTVFPPLSPGRATAYGIGPKIACFSIPFLLCVCGNTQIKPQVRRNEVNPSRLGQRLESNLLTEHW
jgi:hypothetical protein